MRRGDGGFPRRADFGSLGSVGRLGLASRTDNALEITDVFHALDCGVNYLNWPGRPDAISAAIAQMSPARRAGVFVAVQLEARGHDDARREIDRTLRELGTDYLDVVTYYYVQRETEWREIQSRDGAAAALERARQDGKVRLIGMTSHQRVLAARCAASGKLDMLMIRYNAAHRRAEDDVFPTTQALHMPVVAFTGLRWRALLEPTPDDPPDFQPPPAREWYRFVLCHPAVTVALMAPHNRAQLDENLRLLSDWGPLSEEQRAALAAHGDRVRRHAGRFP